MNEQREPGMTHINTPQSLEPRQRMAWTLGALIFLAGCIVQDTDAGDTDAELDTGGGEASSETGVDTEGPPEDLPETFEEACAMVPGCADGPYDPNGPRDPITRVTLRLDDSGVPTFDAMDTAEVLRELGKPAGVAGGTHVIVAEDANGNWLEVQAVSFPTGMLFEDDQGDGAQVLEALEPGDAQSMLYFSSENIDRFVVYDAQGTEVAREDFLAPRSFRAAIASPACRHVVLLEGVEDTVYIPSATLNAKSITAPPANPGPLQRAVLQAALNRMAPTLCHGLGRIGFIEVPQSSLKGFVASMASADLMLLNTQSYSEEALLDRRVQLALTKTIFHEAAHATEHLLQHEGQPINTLIETFLGVQQPVGGWTFESEQVAGDLVRSTRLLGGIRREWLRMHEAFVTEGFGADAYSSVAPDGECAPDLRFYDAEQTTEASFMSRYGGTNHGEDVADMVAWAEVAPMFRAEGVSSIYNAGDTEACGGRSAMIDIPEDSACQAFRDHTEENIPQRLAAAYTKLRLVRELGMISEEAFDTCRGEVGFDVPGPGFHVYEDGEFQRSFNQGVTATIGTIDGGPRKFIMNAEGEASFGGETVPAELTLELELGPNDVDISQISWPRGGYRLTEVDQDRFRLFLPDAPAGSFESREGFVLVTAASNDRIEGSVVIQQAWRWLAPLPVPEVYDPPLVFRFLIEN